jgi:hypothetical protein
VIKIDQPRLVDILLSQAKAHKTTPEDQAIRFLRAGLAAERERILAERAAKRAEASAQTAIVVDVAASAEGGYPVEDPCSEEFLRRVCGEWWKECWWAGTCALSG